MDTLYLLFFSILTLVWSQYPFHHYACIHERTAENKIYEALYTHENFLLQQYSEEECFKQCGNRTLLLYKAHANLLDNQDDQSVPIPLDNCFCIGHVTQKNISLWIYPSDIISKGEQNCSGRSLFCQATNDYNWCSSLDQRLNQSVFEIGGDIDNLYKNFNPKCVNSSFLNTTNIIHNNNDATVASCQASCRSSKFYMLQVKYNFHGADQKYSILNSFLPPLLSRVPDVLVEMTMFSRMSHLSSCLKKPYVRSVR